MGAQYWTSTCPRCPTTAPLAVPAGHHPPDGAAEPARPGTTPVPANHGRSGSLLKGRWEDRHRSWSPTGLRIASAVNRHEVRCCAAEDIAGSATVLPVLRPHRWVMLRRCSQHHNTKITAQLAIPGTTRSRPEHPSRRRDLTAGTIPAAPGSTRVAPGLLLIAGRRACIPSPFPRDVGVDRMAFRSPRQILLGELPWLTPSSGIRGRARPL